MTTEYPTISYYDIEPDLDTIQRTVEGYFTIIPLKDRLMYVNEEGALQNLPVNKQASNLVGYQVYGNVILVSNK